MALTIVLPPSALFPHGWSGGVADARALQTELAAQVRLRDEIGAPRWIAGVDAGLDERGTMVRAAAVLIDATTLAPVAEALARVPLTMPYVPGLLSFRELPAVLAALAQLPRTPELVMCDGHGIAHPRRLGIAAHLGVATGLATIGVAKKVLVGHHAEPGPLRGDRSELIDRGEVIGTVLRTRERVRPLIVSPGHRVDAVQAPALVLACTTRYRLPEPTRLADRLASQRDRRPDLFADERT